MTTEEYEKEMKIFQKKIEEIKNQNHSDFEKQLIFISSGALGLSMFFVEKIVKDLNSSNCRILLILAWITLGLTLIVNLISHFISIAYNEKTLREIGQKKTNNQTIEARHRRLNRLNLITLILLIFGITFLILYLTFNVMRNTDTIPVQPSAPSNDGTRSYVPPPPPPPPSVPVPPPPPPSKS